MKVLYLEDNIVDADLLKHGFARSAPHIEVEWVDTLDKALLVLSECTPENPLYDVVLVDLQLPEGVGTSLIPFLRRRQLPIAVVVVTGIGDEELAVSALKTGASDYVIKHQNHIARLPLILETAAQRYKTEISRFSRPLRVLYGENNPLHGEEVFHHFSNYAPFLELDIAGSAEEVIEKLTLPAEPEGILPQGYDILLSEYNLSGMKGIELIQEVHVALGINIPIVILSEEDDEDLAVQAMRMGAADYIFKRTGYLLKLPAVLENAYNKSQLEKEREALRASEAYFRSIIENTHGAIVVTDANRNIRYASPSFERLSGFGPDELDGVMNVENTHPDDLPSMVQAMEATFRNPGSPGPTIEIRVRHKNGSWHIIEATGKAIRDQSGQFLNIINMHDVTERKRVEEALRKSEEQLKLKLDSILSPDTDIDEKDLLNVLDINAIKSLLDSFFALTGMGISIMDLKGNILAASGKMQEICANFHMVHPAARADCLESSKKFVRDIPEGRYRISKCVNNLCDVATPLVIGGKHVGHIIFGQFFFEGEEPDENAFLAQAEKYGFDMEQYLSALKKVQRVSHDRVTRLMDYLSQFSTLVCRLSYSNVKLAKAIAEQKRAEDALTESEEKFRSLVNASTVGVFIVQDGFFRFVNNKFCDIHGYSREEIIGKMRPEDLLHPDYREMVEQIMRLHVLGIQDENESEFQIIRKDGSMRIVKVFGAPVILNGHSASTGTIIDITKERALESQLLQAQKMEAIGTLAGGVAHDFNNILTALTGYGTLLQMKLGDDSPLRIYADQVISASQKAANLTGSLLAFSRQQPVILKPININSIIKETEKLLRRLLIEDITLKTILANEDLMIMGDATQIDQILINLTTNARDAMPKGGTFTIETKSMYLDTGFVDIHGFDRPGKYTVIAFSDTGIGMDEITQEHIFDPFFTTKEVGKGTGLGLSTVYGVVKQHDGYISVYSEPGLGTTFRIYIPAVEAENIGVVLPFRSQKKGHETILIAEDNEIVRRLMGEVLTEYGYTILEAVDGDDALAKYGSNKDRIDLLVLDSVMPGKNGREVHDEIKKMNPHVKTLFTSGYTRDIILDKGIEDKTFDFISKPLSPGEFLEKVREILDR